MVLAKVLQNSLRLDHSLAACLTTSMEFPGAVNFFCEHPGLGDRPSRDTHCDTEREVCQVQRYDGS